jgi:hypothetical protein
MSRAEKSGLSISRKFEILCLLLSGENPALCYDEMGFQELNLIREFILEKIVEFGIRRKGNYFSPHEISTRLLFLNSYPQEKNCRHSAPTCITGVCFDLQHECYMTRFKLEINALFQLAKEYLFS